MALGLFAVQLRRFAFFIGAGERLIVSEVDGV